MFSPASNISGGVQYLASLLRDFKRNLDLAVAADNAGPAAVGKYSAGSPFPETQVYVERLKILHQRLAIAAILLLIITAHSLRRQCQQAFAE